MPGTIMTPLAGFPGPELEGCYHDPDTVNPVAKDQTHEVEDCMPVFGRLFLGLPMELQVEILAEVEIDGDSDLLDIPGLRPLWQRLRIRADEHSATFERDFLPNVRHLRVIGGNPTQKGALQTWQQQRQWMRRTFARHNPEKAPFPRLTEVVIENVPRLIGPFAPTLRRMTFRRCAYHMSLPEALEWLDIRQTQTFTARISDKKYLRYLDASFTKFDEDVPESLEVLIIERNRTFYRNLDRCLNLRHFDCSFTFYNRAVPAASLVVLKITGNLSFNQDLAHLRHLKHFDCSTTIYNGLLPPSLEVLKITGNQNFQQPIAGLKRLRDFDCADTAYDQPVPETLVHLTVAGNMAFAQSVDHCSALRTFDCSLTTWNDTRGIPETLEVLCINDNGAFSADVSKLHSLRVLECVNTAYIVDNPLPHGLEQHITEDFIGLAGYAYYNADDAE
eukprot:Clim_evm4s81 gene=Clim_evmTU4s81